MIPVKVVSVGITEGIVSGIDAFIDGMICDLLLVELTKDIDVLTEL